MRLAILAGSSYAQNDQLVGLPHAESQIDLLRQRLSEQDAGFSAYALVAERGMADELENLLTNPPEPVDALLLFFSGYVVVSEEGLPALLLDGERLSTLSLRRLRRLANRCSASSFLILDTVSAFDGQYGAEQMVRSLNEAVAGEHAGIHLLATNRPAGDDADGPSPFTNLLALTLDWHASEQGLAADGLFAAMRAEEALFAQTACAEFFPAKAAFEVLLSQRSWIPTAPPAAEPTPPDDQAEARADALVEASDFDAALADYSQALDRLGPVPTAEHPVLIAKIASALRGAHRDEDALAYYEAALALEPTLASALEGAADLRMKLGHASAAIELLERWLNVDPNALIAVERAGPLLAEAQDWGRLATLYESALARVSDPVVAVELAIRIDKLCKDKLGTPGRAASSLERAAELMPGDQRIHARLVEPCEATGRFADALLHQLAALRAEPTRAEFYRTAMRLFERCGDADGAWNAACALEVLGDADVNESLAAAAHRPDGLLPVRECLNEEHWKKRLFCPERDASLDDVFSALGEALVEVGLETARRKRRLVTVDASTELDPKLSTVTLVKTLAWSARLFGFPAPKVHVVPGLPTSFAAPPSREPILLVSKTLGTGLPMPALTFLWSRQLTFLRPEHRAFLFFPNVPELAALCLAALSIGGAPQAPFKQLQGDAKLFARGLRRHLPSDALERLQALAQKFPLREASKRVRAWARAVELASGRAGLVGCGNIEVAVKMMRTLQQQGTVGVEEQVSDVLAFSVSTEYAAVRERLGVLVRQ